VNIQPITAKRRGTVNQILKDEWDCPPCVTRGKAIDTTDLSGFVSLSGNKISGVITYRIDKSECEIVTLNSFDENKGIGTALINAVAAAAKEAGCRRLWLVTTNDNVGAIRFYQKKGFDLAAVHLNAIEISRKIKPSIPLIGTDDIPILHEFEFEMKI